ncbi:MAG: putative ABC transport system ATP-binding protein [Candidatus Promineifilaceae bacterium]|jgi:putative ABC transport system ATP-binding protein
MPILEARNITKTYEIGDRSIDVLHNVSFGISAGEFVAIIGSSGSGKSTLLSIMSGLDHATVGSIWIQGDDITHLTEDDLAPLRNETIGFVFQSFHLIPSLSAIENIMFPAELQGNANAQEKAESLLKRVNLLDRAENFPHQLSGGEKQRVAICRALINDPKIIFADEPTGNLDTENGRGILDLLFELKKEIQTTLVLVTHDPEVAKLADRVIRLEDGRIASDQSAARS